MLKSTMNNECAHHICDTNQCKVTERRSCVGCSFFTTTAQSVERKKKASARLRSLSKRQQMEIADKYYGGATPWQTSYRSVAAESNG